MKRRHRSQRTVLLSCGAGLVLGVAYVAGTSLAVHSELAAVRSDAAVLEAHIRAGEFSAASAKADSLTRNARRAHRMTGGPAWWAAQRSPVVGSSFRTIAGIAATADELAGGALPRLVAVGDLLDPATLRQPGGGIDVAALRSSAAELDAAAASLDRAAGIVARLPSSTGMGALDRARVDIVEVLGTLGSTLERAQLAARILPPMLGADRPKTYFVAFQNDAEARGTGGLPGAFAILRADRGRLEFVRFESDQALFGVEVNPKLPAEFEQMYGSIPRTLYLNSNVSPHFPYAARIWAAMWEKKSGERIDGALALDPTTLSYLLAATGPVALPSGERISASSVVRQTQSEAYLRFGTDVAGRKRYLIDIARTVADRITEFQGEPSGLLRGLARAVDERRFLAWSAEPAVQAELATTAISGAIARSEGPYAGLTIVNFGGNKLDYYLDRSLAWERVGCGPQRRVRATIRLTNTVPASVTSPYVVGRSDLRPYRVAPGDNRLAVYYAATRGANLTRASIDGKPVFVARGTERGRPVFVADVELPRGATRTVLLELVEPGTAGPPAVLRQPLVRPLASSIRDAACPS